MHSQISTLVRKAEAAVGRLAACLVDVEVEAWLKVSRSDSDWSEPHQDPSQQLAKVNVLAGGGLVCLVAFSDCSVYITITTRRNNNYHFE